MSEIAAAFGVLVAPFWNTMNFIFVEPILFFTGFWIDFFSRYVLDARIGHVFIRTVLSPFLTYSLARVFDCRRVFQIFEGMEESTRIVVAAASDLLNWRLLNDPLKQIISNVGTVYCDVMYGKEARYDAFLFFYMCSYQTGRLVGLDLGTGDLNDCDNCFFPRTLGVGPQDIPDENREIRKKLAEMAAKKPVADKKEHKFIVGAGHRELLGEAQLEELTRNLLTEMSKNQNMGLGGAPSFPSKSVERWNSDRNLYPTTYETTQGSHNAYIPENVTCDSTDVDQQTTFGSSPDNKLNDKTKPINGTKNGVKTIPATSTKQSIDCSTKKHGLPSAEKNNLQVAMSCLFFSLLTYRTDTQLDECKKNGMIPGVDILTVETGSSGTQMIAFVDIKHKYAVFGYRGTEFEVIRQMLTSLDFRLEYFETNEKKRDPLLAFRTMDTEHKEFAQHFSSGDDRAHIRKVYMNEVKKSSEMYNFKQKVAGENLTPLALIKYLNNIHGFKIYLTGHSLGGGLATVLAARLMSLNIKFTAVVTFGGTPVGDESFVKWFNKKVPCSWRFVFGDEFAPMVPPIPWAQPPEDVKLVHVGHFYHIDLPKRIVPKNAKEANKLIEDLAFETGMMNMIVHHNPLMTMRALKFFYYGDDLPASKRLRLDIGGEDC